MTESLGARDTETVKVPGDLLNVALVLLRRWRVVVVVPLALCTIVGSVILLQARTYSSTLAFAPSSSASAAARFAGIAAQFGVSLGGSSGDATQSPDLYVDLIRSDQLLRELAVAKFWRLGTAGDTIRGTLADLYEVDGATEAERVYATMMRLRQDVQVNTGLKSGLVNLRARAEWPEVALQLAERTLSLVNEFGNASRQRRAEAEREYTEGRLREAATALAGAENVMRDFLLENRNYQSSPRLQLEFDRLQRRVTIAEQVYAALIQSFEQARLDEFRNTPVTQIVEPPVLALWPDRRGLILRLIGVGILGCGIGIAFALVREILETLRRTRADDARELARLGNGARRDLRRAILFWRKDA